MFETKLLKIISLNPKFQTLDMDAVSDQSEHINRTGFSRFLHNLQNPAICYIRDQYPIMFFLDFVCMCILICFYSQFGEANSNSNVLTVS
jgi:hypothetical protein